MVVLTGVELQVFYVQLVEQALAFYVWTVCVDMVRNLETAMGG